MPAEGLIYPQPRAHEIREQHGEKLRNFDHQPRPASVGQPCHLRLTPVSRSWAYALPQTSYQFATVCRTPLHNCFLLAATRTSDLRLSKLGALWRSQRRPRNRGPKLEFDQFSRLLSPLVKLDRCRWFPPCQKNSFSDMSAVGIR